MASSSKPPLEDTRRTTGSPKMKTRGESRQMVVSQKQLGSYKRGWKYRDGTAGLAGRRRDEISCSLGFELENAKDTLCRNVTIYGRCRYEDKGD